VGVRGAQSRSGRAAPLRALPPAVRRHAVARVREFASRFRRGHRLVTPTLRFAFRTSGLDSRFSQVRASVRSVWPHLEDSENRYESAGPSRGSTTEDSSLTSSAHRVYISDTCPWNPSAPVRTTGATAQPRGLWLPGPLSSRRGIGRPRRTPGRWDRKRPSRLDAAASTVSIRRSDCERRLVGEGRHRDGAPGQESARRAPPAGPRR